MKRSKLWSGLTSTSAALLVVGLIGQNLAAANASYINTALGTTTTKVVQTGEVGDTTYFKSQFGALMTPMHRQPPLPLRWNRTSTRCARVRPCCATRTTPCR